MEKSLFIKHTSICLIRLKLIKSINKRKVSGKMDLKSIAEAYQSVQEGKVNAGLQAYLDKKKGKKENGDQSKKREW